jgi:hypothetical protein
MDACVPGQSSRRLAERSRLIVQQPLWWLSLCIGVI